MTTTTEPPLEPFSAPEAADGAASPVADDVANSSFSNSSTTNTDSTSGRPYTPSSLPGTPGTPSSTTLLDTELASVDDDQSEADSASATGTLAHMLNAAPRPKYHRHISRSAAMRDSVATLPSIQNLRLHFSNGAKTEYRAGHGVGISGGLGVMLEDGEDSSMKIGLGRPPPQHPWKDFRLQRVAPEQARAEAGQLAAIVRKRWGVDRGLPNSATPPPERSDDVRTVFIETARAVRRVRTLVLSLVAPGVGHRRVSGPPKNGPAFSTPSRPAKPISRVVSGPANAAAPQVPDPTMPVRRAAIELLGNLRTMEDRIRVKHDMPVVVVIPDAGGESTLVTSPVDEQGILAWNGGIPDRPYSVSPPPDIRGLSLSTARLSVSSLDDSIFSEDEDWTINDFAREAEARDRPHEAWEDRLVTEDRAYKILDGTQWADGSIAIRDAARRWADAVDLVFGQHETSSPAISWISSGSNDLERARAFLIAHLEPEHAALLPSTDEGLLTRLSDGYLLVQAYNALVHTSHRQWGFIQDDDVHDTIRNSSITPPPDEDGTESSAKEKEWTFRRVGNLTAWAAAIRLRYNLPIVLPHSAVLAPPTLPDGKPIPRAVSTSAVKRKDAPRIDFDPLLVAKRDPEGESMLKSLLAIWVGEAVREVMGSEKGDVEEDEGAKGEKETEDD